MGWNRGRVWNVKGGTFNRDVAQTATKRFVAPFVAKNGQLATLVAGFVVI